MSEVREEVQYDFGHGQSHHHGQGEPRAQEPTPNPPPTQGRDRHVEREFEVGSDEAWKARIFEKDGLYFANNKRTYDEYQDISLARRKEVELANSRSQAHLDDVKSLSYSRAQSHYDDVNSLFKQHMQNAVENANMCAKQVLRTNDIAIDRQWNINETDSLSAKSGVQQDALASALAKGVAVALAAMEKE